jgi:hypothetical protein
MSRVQLRTRGTERGDPGEGRVGDPIHEHPIRGPRSDPVQENKKEREKREKEKRKEIGYYQ